MAVGSSKTGQKAAVSAAKVENTITDSGDSLVLSLSSPRTLVTVLLAESKSTKTATQILNFLSKCLKAGPKEAKEALLQSLEGFANVLGVEDQDPVVIQRTCEVLYGALTTEHSNDQQSSRPVTAAPNLTGSLITTIRIPTLPAEAQDAACTLLSVLATQPNNAFRIAAEKGAQEVMNLTASPDPDVRKAALECLCTLIHCHDSFLGPVASAPSKWIKQIASPYQDIQIPALKILRRLLQNHGTRMRLRYVNELNLLASCLKPNSEETGLILEILSESVKDATIKNTVITSESVKGIQQCVLHWKTGHDPASQDAACAMMKLLVALYHTGTTDLQFVEWMDNLLNLPTASTPTSVASFECLCSLIQTYSVTTGLQRNLFLEDITRSSIVPKLWKATYEARNYCGLLAFASLISHEKLRDGLRQFQDQVIELIIGSELNVHASQFLLKYVKEATDRQACLDKGLLRVLLAKLQSSPDDLSYIMFHILAWLLQEPKAADAFESADPWPTLRAGLCREPLAEPCILIVETLIKDVKKLELAIEYDCIELLWSRRHESPSAVQVLQRLLERQTSLKYMLTDSLGVDDKVDSGFWDVGFTNKQTLFCHWNAGLVKPGLWRCPKQMPETGDVIDGGDVAVVVDDELQLNVKCSGANIRSREEKEIQAIATAVAERFAESTLEGLREQSCTVSLSPSSIMPLSKVSRNKPMYRALYFKALCDRAGIGCKLERNQYRKAWNEVSIEGKSYVVDLIEVPGVLMEANSDSALAYVGI